MNKTRIDSNILVAYEAIQKADIVEKNGKVKKSYRGQISTLGAAITLGSLKSAICYFNAKAENNTDVDRTKLLKAIQYVLITNEETKAKYESKASLWDMVKDIQLADSMEIKEDIINAAIAIKLAFNLYELED